MENLIPAIINWQNHRKNNLLSSTKYCTVAKFEEDVNWRDEAWSIVIDFDKPPTVQGIKSKGLIRFLSPEGPTERLKSVNKFELYEGEKLTAIVEIC